MKPASKANKISLVVLAAGAVGAAARAVLYATGYDSRGLLAAFHPMHLMCWFLTLAVAGYLVWALRDMKEEADYDARFPASDLAMAGSFLAAACLALEGAASFGNMEGPLGLMRTAGLFCAAAALAAAGWCRRQGKKPFFGIYGVVCLYFAVEMIASYRVWSGEPQVQDYCFRLLGCACLTLTAYHRTALIVGLGKWRPLVFCGMMAQLLCLLSLTGPGHIWVYLAGLLWTAADLYPQEPKRRAKYLQKDGER